MNDGDQAADAEQDQHDREQEPPDAEHERPDGEQERPVKWWTVAAVAVAAAVVIVIVVVAATGSSTTLNPAGVESQVEHDFATKYAVVTHVTCPTNVADEVGHSFNCTAALDAGSIPVGVKIISTTPHLVVTYTYPAAVHTVNTTHLAQKIETYLRQHGHPATVSCPQFVLSTTGVTFACQAIPHHGEPVLVKGVVLANGSVRWAPPTL
ncbi:MAG TPA: DUF4333 domain-containing protein [Solirubrobacteraceae bacterium]|nr:DUF4333 domain-containing protein [Solirubrobacteraceae bacterium]